MSQSDKNISNVPIIDNDHQDLLEATLIKENTENVIQNLKACAVECHSKRVCRLSLCSWSTTMKYQLIQDISYITHMS